MDWAAIGGVAAIAAVIIAWLQLRHSKAAPNNATLTPTVPKDAPPPEIQVEVREGQGRYRFPEGWMASHNDTRWLAHQEMEHELGRINFASAMLKNPNNFAIGPIDLELPAFDVWSAEITYATSLAKTAVKIEINSQHVLIRIFEMPAHEILLFSLLGGGFISNMFASANGAVKLKKRWIFDA